MSWNYTTTMQFFLIIATTKSYKQNDYIFLSFKFADHVSCSGTRQPLNAAMCHSALAWRGRRNVGSTCPSNHHLSGQKEGAPMKTINWIKQLLHIFKITSDVLELHNIDTSLSPVKTRGYRVELVRLSVCPSVCPSVRPSVCPAWDRVLCARELGMKELS